MPDDEAGAPAASVNNIWQPLGAASGWEAGLVVIVHRYCIKERAPCQEFAVLWLFENVDNRDQNMIEFGNNDLDGEPKYIELEARKMDVTIVKELIGRLGNIPNENADEVSSTLHDIIESFCSLTKNPPGEFIGRARKVFKGDPKDKVEDPDRSFTRGDVTINKSNQFRVGRMQNPVHPHEWVAVTANITLFATRDADLVSATKEGNAGTMAFKPSRLGYLVVQVERPNVVVDAASIRAVETFADGRASDCIATGHTEHSVFCAFSQLQPYTKIELKVPVKPER